MNEPMTVDELAEQLRESIAGLGQALSLALIPAISAINAAVIQMAVAYEDELVAALNNYRLDWDSLEKQMTINNPHRWQFESLVDWGNRLERAGLLDKYEYRLMYGAECWRAILWSPVWYAGEVWYWLRYEAWEVLRGLWANRNDG